MSKPIPAVAYAVVAASMLTLVGPVGCHRADQDRGRVISANMEEPDAVRQAREAHSTADARLIDADNGFGLQLFQALHKQAPARNLFISPASIALALHMVYNGARGATQQAMALALQLQGMNADTVNKNNAALLAGLSGSDPSVELRIANALYLRPDHPPLPDFIERNQTYYGAELGDLAGAPDNVNAWVSTQTNGKITHLVALLVDAVYFKGKWNQPFEAGQTQSATFTLSAGTQRPCQMMHQSGSYPYYKGDGFESVRLDYGQGGTSMVILLPASGTSLDSLLTRFNLPDWKKWGEQFHSARGQIGLPRIHVEYQADLIPPLTAQGMGIAFDSNRADFAGIAPQTYLKKILHKTYLDVDEQGTEAAAATAVEATTGGMAMEPSDHFIMTLDRPFVCAIVDDRTGVLLFLGAVYEP